MDNSTFINGYDDTGGHKSFVVRDMQGAVSVPSPLQFFIDYINVLEGCKSRIKNLHWASKRLPNGEKMAAHLRLDELLDETADFQDTVAENASGILGAMQLNDIQGIPFNCSNCNDLMVYMLQKTVEFYSGLPVETRFVGIKSETENFIKVINRYKYLFDITE